MLTHAALWCSVGTPLALAQDAGNTTLADQLSTSVSDDGRYLEVQVRGVSKGQPLDFKARYEVANWSETQKRSRLNTLRDSLGIGLSLELPQAPLKPWGYEDDPEARLASVRITCNDCPPSGNVWLVSDDGCCTVCYSYSPDDEEVFPIMFRNKPGQYTLKYSSQGEVIKHKLSLKQGETAEVKLR